MARLLSKSPKDPLIKGNFIKIRKEYRKLLRANKKKYEIENLNTLQSLASEPKKFWNFLKKLNNKSKRKGNLVSEESWVEHFSGINKKDPAFIPDNVEQCMDIEQKMNCLLDNYTGNSLCPILDKEFIIQEVQLVLND